MANATRPVVEIVAGAPPPKRKRDASEDAFEAAQVPPPSAKRPREDAALVDAPEAVAENEARTTTREAVDPDALSNIIESQFSLEILLKHNELRLINQELAKCQAALEQLRRCHLIPYPATQRTPESMLHVANGTGPALQQKGSVPRWAPPFGVTDGPYSRHYAKWLIPDPDFDGVQVEWQRGPEGSRAGKSLPEGRSTRHSIAEGVTSASKARSQRGSASQKLQALSNGYPQAKEKAGPCILKRGDGQTVKLVCIDCHRDNFSSTQGFINHCRIAHRRDFKSHEEAAVASGQPVEVDESGGIVGEEKPASSASSLVHPLIRSASTNRDVINTILSRIKVAKAMFAEGKMPGITSIPSADPIPPRPSPSFVPSSTTPHLSELMRSKGFAGDLNQMVDDASKRIDFDEISLHEEDLEDIDQSSGLPEGSHGVDGADSAPPMRVPARAGMSLAHLGRPSSSKGLDSRNGRAAGVGGMSPRPTYSTPVLSSSTRPPSSLANLHGEESSDHAHEGDLDIVMMDDSLIPELSPHTVASNNAPSLVSDDGEYDDHDVDSGSDHEDESSVAEIDIEDDGDKVVPRTVLRHRAGSGGGETMRLRKEEKEKHVTFVSPVKEASKGRRGRRA